MKHKIRINVATNGTEQQVLSSSCIKMPVKILHWLFGDFCEILVLTPGKSVQEVEIQEISENANKIN